MANLRTAMEQYTEISTTQNPQTYVAFFRTLTMGHTADMEEQKAAIMKAMEMTADGKRVKGVIVKDLKPEKYEGKKSVQSFKQWAEDTMAWVYSMDHNYAKALDIANELKEWSTLTFEAELTKAGLPAKDHADLERNLTDVLKTITKGEAREVIDTSNEAGEAWFRLHDRFYSKTLIGATSTATRLQELRRLGIINDSYQLLNLIRMLVQEFQRQSPTDPLPKATVKAAYMKVVPEAYKRGLEMQIDVDKSEVHIIEDKVMQFIRTHGTGPVGMDTNNLGKEEDPWYVYPPSAPSWNWTADEYHNGEAASGDADGQEGAEVNAFGKAKGKGKADGKGGFKGQCYQCGQYGHSQRFCPQKGKGKVKGKDFGGKGGSRKRVWIWRKRR